MYYNSQTWLTGKKGNNAISYDDRKELGSQLKLHIPELIEGKLIDVKIEQNLENICFEEVGNQYSKGVKNVQSHLGLQNLVKINMNKKSVYIIDNHNHAFYCWSKSINEGEMDRGYELIHIDQHSDLSIPESYILKRDLTNNDLVAKYTNEVLEVGNFILAAMECGLISGQHQVRSEYSLLNLNLDDSQYSQNLILDIDLDFRAPEMGIEEFEKTIKMVKEIISHPKVKCITIATSPYFMYQVNAIKYLSLILS